MLNVPTIMVASTHDHGAQDRAGLQGADAQDVAGEPIARDNVVPLSSTIDLLLPGQGHVLDPSDRPRRRGEVAGEFCLAVI
jgi:hypothetical protein